MTLTATVLEDEEEGPSRSEGGAPSPPSSSQVHATTCREGQEGRVPMRQQLGGQTSLQFSLGRVGHAAVRIG